jgi:hypothetical protein
VLLGWVKVNNIAKTGRPFTGIVTHRYRENVLTRDIDRLQLLPQQKNALCEIK